MNALLTLEGQRKVSLKNCHLSLKLSEEKGGLTESAGGKLQALETPEEGHRQNGASECLEGNGR